jgi:hypothetical protein
VFSSAMKSAGHCKGKVRPVTGEDPEPLDGVGG